MSSFIGRILVDFKNVLLPNFLLERKLVPFLFQERCQFKYINQLLFENIEQIETKRILFEQASYEIIDRMSYKQSRNNFNFSKNSSNEIISIINNFN